MNKIAQVVSVAFHPLCMPLYATWLLMHSSSYISHTMHESLQHFLYVLIFVTTYLLPACMVWMLWQKGWISSLELSERSERHIPFLLTIACYGFGIYLLLKIQVSILFPLSLLGAMIAVFLAFLINLRWKISIHMIGIGGMMGLFFGYGISFQMNIHYALIALSVIAGLLGTARLVRKAHTPAQVYTGFIAGFMVESVFMKLTESWLTGS